MTAENDHSFLLEPHNPPPSKRGAASGSLSRSRIRREGTFVGKEVNTEQTKQVIDRKQEGALLGRQKKNFNWLLWIVLAALVLALGAGIGKLLSLGAWSTMLCKPRDDIQAFVVLIGFMVFVFSACVTLGHAISYYEAQQKKNSRHKRRASCKGVVSSAAISLTLGTLGAISLGTFC